MDGGSSLAFASTTVTTATAAASAKRALCTSLASSLFEEKPMVGRRFFMRQAAHLQVQISKWERRRECVADWCVESLCAVCVHACLTCLFVPLDISYFLCQDVEEFSACCIIIKFNVKIMGFGIWRKLEATHSCATVNVTDGALCNALDAYDGSDYEKMKHPWHTVRSASHPPARTHSYNSCAWNGN